MLQHGCKVEPAEEALQFLENTVSQCNAVMAASEPDYELEVPAMSVVVGNSLSDHDNVPSSTLSHMRLVRSGSVSPRRLGRPCNSHRDFVAHRC